MKTYKLEMRDDGGSAETIELEAETLDEALKSVDAECESWARNGDWGDDGACVTVGWFLLDEVETLGIHPAFPFFQED